MKKNIRLMLALICSYGYSTMHTLSAEGNITIEDLNESIAKEGFGQSEPVDLNGVQNEEKAEVASDAGVPFTPEDELALTESFVYQDQHGQSNEQKIESSVFTDEKVLASADFLSGGDDMIDDVNLKDPVESPMVNDVVVTADVVEDTVAMAPVVYDARFTEKEEALLQDIFGDANQQNDANDVTTVLDKIEERIQQAMRNENKDNQSNKRTIVVPLDEPRGPVSCSNAYLAGLSMRYLIIGAMVVAVPVLIYKYGKRCKKTIQKYWQKEALAKKE